MKGSVLDILFIIVIMLITSIITIAMFTFLSVVNDRLQDIDSVPQEAKDSFQASVDTWLFFDWVLILMVGGMMVVVIVGASQINAHPIFFVGGLIFLIVLVMVSAQFTNMFMAFVENTTIAPYANQFAYTVQFHQNLPLIALMYAIVVFVVMYSFGGRNEYDG